MAQLQSFEAEIADTTTPGVIMRKIGHEVCAGMKTAQWTVQGLGAYCTLNYYQEERVVIDGAWWRIDRPHYLLHANYQRDNRDALLLMRFVEADGELVKGERDLVSWDQEGHKSVREVEIHPDEAKWVCGLLMKAGIEQAEQTAEKWDRKQAETALLREQYYGGLRALTSQA